MTWPPGGRSSRAARTAPTRAGRSATLTASQPSLSADGARVAFSSARRTSSQATTDDDTDVYVRDLGAGRTLLIEPPRPARAGRSSATAAGAPSAISGDGRRVAFDSTGALVPGDSNAARDVFVRDLDAPTAAARASRRRRATRATRTRTEASISRDGTRVSFLSTATSFGAVGGRQQLFVRDLTAGTLELASRADGRDGAAVDVADRGLHQWRRAQRRVRGSRRSPGPVPGDQRHPGLRARPRERCDAVRLARQRGAGARPRPRLMRPSVTSAQTAAA